MNATISAGQIVGNQGTVGFVGAILIQKNIVCPLKKTYLFEQKYVAEEPNYTLKQVYISSFIFYCTMPKKESGLVNLISEY